MMDLAGIMFPHLGSAVEKAVAPHRRCLQPPPGPQLPARSPAIVENLPLETQLAPRARARHADVYTLAAQGLPSAAGW